MTDDDILSEEDKNLFRHHMRGVKPLHSSQKSTVLASLKTKPSPSIQSPRSPVAESRNIKYQQTLIAERHLYYDDAEAAQTETILSFTREPIHGQKRLYELKRGLIPYQARFDLHGLTVEAAEKALCHFIQEQISLKNRCFLLIHGKGSRYGGIPVLKNHVYCWLQQFPEVLAFHSALNKHGGGGAVYVLLRNSLP